MDSRQHQDAFEVKYNGKSKPIMDWLKGATVRDITGIADSDHGSVKDIFESVASFILEDYFQSLAQNTLSSHSVLLKIPLVSQAKMY